MDTEPNQNTRRHPFATILFFLTFFLFIGVIGPEKILHIDTGTEVVTNLEPSVTPPQLEQGISAPTTFNNTIDGHILTPTEVRGIYISGWTAGSAKGLNRTLALYDDSVLNSVVIDIKDATGKLSYMPVDPALAATGVGTKRIANLSGVIDEFHEKGIYVIGRLTVFQDPYYASQFPSETFLNTQTNTTWKDYKGIAWLRPDSTQVADYTKAIALDAYTQGFDEINLDYVRYPSDGDLKYLDLSQVQGSKALTLQKFFVEIDRSLRSQGISVTADVFGLTMSAQNDVGIGQKAELIAPYVDALAPMLYPSHFWNGTYGIAVPAAEPYRVIHKSLSDGIAKLEKIGIPKEKLRPWFQDFDLVGVSYTPELVQAQIQASADLGIHSWLMWDPANTYTKEVYKVIPDDMVN